MKLRVELPDEVYVFDPREDITLADMFTIETESDGAIQSAGQWIDEIDAGKNRACQLLVWWLRRRDGRQEDSRSVNFPPLALRLTAIDEVDEDPEASAGSEPATEDPSPAGLVSVPLSGTA